MVMLLFLTGARRGEALKAKWEDFDLDRGIWKVRRQTLKGGVRHAISLERTLSAQALELLKDWRRSREAWNQYVFPQEKNSTKRRYDIKKPWDRIRSFADLKDFRMHDLRHCFATYAFRAGHQLAVIGEQMGHLSSATTLRYAHVEVDQKRKVAEDVSNAIFEPQ